MIHALHYGPLLVPLAQSDVIRCDARFADLRVAARDI